MTMSWLENNFLILLLFIIGPRMLMQIISLVRLLNRQYLVSFALLIEKSAGLDLRNIKNLTSLITALFHLKMTKWRGFSLGTVCLFFLIIKVGDYERQ